MVDVVDSQTRSRMMSGIGDKEYQTRNGGSVGIARHERSFVQVRLDQGFDDVDEFLSFSLSVQNRRKSRMGYAFENHLMPIFESRNLQFERGCRTENHS